MSAGVSLDSMEWGTPEFKRANNMGVQLNLAVLELGFSVIAADVDTVWMKDPVEFFERYSRADMLFSSDGSFSTHKDGGLEDYGGRDPPNSGLYLLRPSAENFTRAWVEATEAGEAVWENQALWDLFFENVTYIPDDPDRLFKVYNGTVYSGVLPVATFAHTFTFFSQHLHEKLGLEPYVVHTTHQFAGLTGKRHRLRDALLWNDPPEYFDSPDGFIMWDMDLPEDMLINSAPKDMNTANFNDTEGHFVLVHYQLAQVRQALAIAKSLNRILIMSEFWCGHERSVWPHPGVIYGTQNMSLPFVCPLNQVLDLDVMKPEKRPGNNDPSLEPYIDFRESSFLRNPRYKLVAENIFHANL
ncbi:hypothetical protein BSKO_12290 [Bryopsis sp. KO-2023]|nr:hypothetical protein BSKO_12290 [Bryopsis sp. KO-2023]